MTRKLIFGVRHGAVDLQITSEVRRTSAADAAVAFGNIADEAAR
jgi:hypothetical protein